jgi:ribosomal protein S18 acetylase RimI-like enzyme
MEIKIRSFLESDLDQIKKIILNAENFGEPFLDSELQRIKIYKTIPKLGKTLVAVGLKDNIVLGYICIEFKWRSLVIQSMIIHHDYLRKGIGTQLVDKVIEIGEQYPTINVIRVDTGDFMDYAQKFYLSCGFQICGYVAHDMSWFNHQVHFAYPLKGVEED